MLAVRLRTIRCSLVCHLGWKISALLPDGKVRFISCNTSHAVHLAQYISRNASRATHLMTVLGFCSHRFYLLVVSPWHPNASHLRCLSLTLTFTDGVCWLAAASMQYNTSYLKVHSLAFTVISFYAGCQPLNCSAIHHPQRCLRTFTVIIFCWLAAPGMQCDTTHLKMPEFVSYSHGLCLLVVSPWQAGQCADNSNKQDANGLPSL